MHTILLRCLLLNTVFLAGSAVLLFAYPAQYGFTITGGRNTGFVQGGVFMAALLLGISDFAIGAFLLYRLLTGPR